MKWEYKYEQTTFNESVEDMTNRYNKLGREGWEMISGGPSWAMFKRPLASLTEAA